MKPFGKGSKSSQDEVHTRTRYLDHSRRFLEWVDSLGFEHSPLGRLAHHLDQKLGIRRISLLFLFTLSLSFLLFYDFEFPYQVNVGNVASNDINSPISFTVVDEIATERKRLEAESSMPPVFDYYPDVYENVYNRIYKSFRQMREHVRETEWPESTAKLEEVVKSFFKFKEDFEKNLGAEVPSRLFDWLVTQKFSVHTENVTIEALARWSRTRIADSPERVLRADDNSAIIRPVDAGAVGEEFTISRDDVLDLRQRSRFSLDGLQIATTLSRTGQDHVRKLAHSLLVPNLTFNRQETESRRRKARESVLPVQISIKKNQTIVSAGSVIQPIHVTILSEIRNLKSDRRTDFIALVSAILFVVLILVFFSYFRRFTQNRVRVELKDILVMGAVTFIVVAMTKIFLFMTDASFMLKYGGVIPPMVFLFAAPVAAGPMMVGLLITSGEVVWLFTTFLATVLAIMVDMNFPFLVVSIIGGIAAARGVYACKKRNDIYKAGIRAGIVNALSITFILTLMKLGEPGLGEELLWTVPAGFFGGLASSLVAMMLIPLLETVFNYTTDVKLLELSNLNHVLMKEMMVKAQGTYHHSLSVGAMVESAAEEIGANALLGKVMAYYHDIGKMEHAQYFIENQRPGYNPHDHISPYMSKTILIAHVKDGAELGLKHKLGKPIIDGILQHHGTTLISYFYNKALEEQDEDIDHVEESDFRYPGPKPQFREAALVMLADSIEAAARSMSEPTAARLTALVKNIIQNKFIDGQLDECNLTLKDLSVIEEAFKRTLLSIYHQRIDYPHMHLGSVTGGKAKKPSNGTKKGHTA